MPSRRMPAQFFPVQINHGYVVAGGKMEEQPVFGCLLIIKRPFVPDAAFVQQQRLALRIPITGDAEPAGGIKVVLDEFRG